MVPAIVKTDAVVVNIRRINDYARFYRATHCILSVRTFVRPSPSVCHTRVLRRAVSLQQPSLSLFVASHHARFIH